MEQICLSNAPEMMGGAVTAIVTIASLAANLVKSDTTLGKVIHTLALNLSVKK